MSLFYWAESSGCTMLQNNEGTVTDSIILKAKFLSATDVTSAC